MADVPLGFVSRIEKVGGARTPGDNYGLEIFCKDLRNLRFALTKSDRQPRKDVFECLSLHAFPVSNGGQLFSFKFKQQVSQRKKIMYALLNFFGLVTSWYLILVTDIRKNRVGL